MNRVKTLDDLEKMRERLRSEMHIRENSNHPERLPQVRVSMGTCGIAAGAKEVMMHFVSELNKQHIDAVVTQTGCVGCCDREPVVEIALPGCEPVVFGDVTPARVPEFIAKYILAGELVAGVIPVDKVVRENKNSR